MKKRIRELENKRMDFEIKGKRERTAAFSNSLILLFSLCCAGEARAAKLCTIGGSSIYNSYVHGGGTNNTGNSGVTSGTWGGASAGGYLWAVGQNCASDQTPGGWTGGWDYEKTKKLGMTEAVVKTACTGANAYWGIALCSDNQANSGYGYGGYQPSPATAYGQDPANTNAANSKNCYCRMMGQKINGVSSSAAGVWAFLSADAASDCATYCASLCAFYARHNAPFRSAVLAPS
ncbi:MAG: hypothetical protein LBL46_01270, partial [Rickettsiales bacterium]|nr:hypothetical protein [Rickettsiales bacterium]